MIKPLLPIANDWWQHEFNEIEHISLVHAKYGSHHMQKEVADTSTDSNCKNQNILKFEDQVSFHVSPAVCKYNFTAQQTGIQYRFYKLIQLPLVLISPQGPPPKFI